MDVIETGTQCRCPGCKSIVARGARRADSQWVAICEPCGYPLLEDIEQPPKAPMEPASLNAVTGGDTELSAEDIALIERIETLRGDLSYAAFCEKICIPESVWQTRFMGPLSRGNIDPHRRQRLVRALDDYEREVGMTGKAENETIQDEAIRRLMELKGILKVSWGALAMKMGLSSAQILHNRKYEHKQGKLTHKAAVDLLERIERIEHECGIGDEINDAGHDGLDANEPARAGKHEKPQAFLPTDPGNLRAWNQYDEQKGESPDEVDTTKEDGRAERKALALLEEELGIDIETIRKLKPAIEILAVALRNGVPAHVEIDRVDVA